MPNFWSKLGQKFGEAMSGAKTKDVEYQKALEQMNNTEIGITTFRSLLKGFPTCTEPIKKFIESLNHSITKLYIDTNTSFKDYAKIVITVTEQIQGDIEVLNKTIAKLYSKTSEWDKIFKQAKEKDILREEKRKNFDHYESKLQKIMQDDKKKNDKTFFDRNQDKYMKAASEYLDISEQNFTLINNSIKLSLELANPLMSGLILAQKKFYEDVTQKFNSLKNMKEKLDEIKKQEIEPETEHQNENYDPLKYIQDKALMTKTSSSQVQKRSSIIMNQNLITKINDNYLTNDNNTYVRTTNTFGKEVPKERQIKFIQIIDDPY